MTADSRPPRRATELPDGRTLRVRPAARRDVPALVSLFERLSPEDRHRRFFSGFRPDDAFVARLVDRLPEEGALLVAEVDSPAGAEIVAEAEYAVLEDGDGELAITVDRSWRGWIAPYLLDALVELAAERGVRNLRAEVLVQNRPMLALVRARGHAAADTGDPSLVEAVIGTTAAGPSWPPVRRRPRVLVEVPGAHWRLAGGLRDAGVDILGCSGPARRAGGCPLLRGERCPLVEGADVVVHALGADDPRSLELVDAHGRAGTRHLVVDTSRGPAGAQLPPHAVTVDHPTEDEVQALVRSLLSLDYPGSPVPATEPGPDRAVR